MPTADKWLATPAAVKAASGRDDFLTHGQTHAHGVSDKTHSLTGHNIYATYGLRGSVCALRATKVGSRNEPRRGNRGNREGEAAPSSSLLRPEVAYSASNGSASASASDASRESSLLRIDRRRRAGRSASAPCSSAPTVLVRTWEPTLEERPGLARA